MQRCQICGKEIKNKPDRSYHPCCIKKMFDTRYIPTLEISPSNIAKNLQLPGKVLTISCLQPRIGLRLNRKGKCLEPVTKAKMRSADFILKPQVSGFANLPENEHTCMMIARHMGTETFCHCVLPGSDDTLVYVMRLMGRINEKNPKQKSFLELLSKNDKYDGDLIEIGEKIRQLSELPALDIQLFFEILLLSFLLGNSDIHLESFSLFYDVNKNARLSPIYDIISSQIIVPGVEDFAIPMMGKNKDINGIDFQTFSRILKIPEKTYTRIILRFFKGKRVIGKLIKDSLLPIEEKLKLSDLLNDRFKRLLV